MANTFKALTALADWTTPSAPPSVPLTPKVEEKDSTVPLPPAPKAPLKEARDPAVMSLHHDIHIHLPESRDPAVFDAIFDAMKRHLGV